MRASRYHAPRSLRVVYTLDAVCAVACLGLALLGLDFDGGGWSGALLVWLLVTVVPGITFAVLPFLLARGSRGAWMTHLVVTALCTVPCVMVGLFAPIMFFVWGPPLWVHVATLVYLNRPEVQQWFDIAAARRRDRDVAKVF